MQQMMFEAEIWEHGFTPTEVELMSTTHTLQETIRDCKTAHRAILKQNLSFEEPSFRVWFYRPCYEYPYCRTLDSVEEVERYLDGIEEIGAEVVEIEELT